MADCPNYLRDHAELWATDPRAANLRWFEQAAYGLFLHYGLYSQLGRHEWVMQRECIPVAEYEKLLATWDPRQFDADAICDLAIEAGMRYINLTSCHHEGFCLWNSTTETFNSYRAVQRDLVAELAAACDRKGLGFFTYFTYVLNWRHPYALTRDLIAMARPPYQVDEPRYKLTRPEEWAEYWQWSHGCLAELCALPYPLAGIWLDIIMGYYQQPDLIPAAATYQLIRERRPEALISYKQGATGDEDFAAPEFHFRSLADTCRKQNNARGARIAEDVWAINQHKHNEICMTLQENGWGYTASSPHKGPDLLWQSLAYAQAHRCNLLANTGPLPDGSIHEGDAATLRTVGQWIRERGLPTAADAAGPGSADAGAAAV
ncbi:MAG: alpha-L-fucosidase [Fimbriimonadaceae bacterium]|nr:alpha-L-fucosidase [Fimbriimonadaceae bacterium]